MFFNKKITSLTLCLIALALLAGFSGCSSGGDDAPASIQVTIANIDITNMPTFTTMAGFTISLIDETATVTINKTVGYFEMRTVLDGPAAEAVRAFLTNPPTANFSLTFNVELSPAFPGTGKYVVVLGASDDYCKYNGQTTAPYDYGDGTLYTKGKMFITNNSADPTNIAKIGTRDIYNGVIIPWSDFNKGAGNVGYSADDIMINFF